jgi:integrase
LFLATEPTIQQSVDGFITTVKQRYAAPSAAAYAQGLRLFADHLRESYKTTANSSVTSITVEQGETFVAHLQATRSVETEHLYSRILLHYFEYCVQAYNLALNTFEFGNTLDHIRRAKSHVIPSVPTEYIDQIIRYARSTMLDRPSEMSSERRYFGTLRDKAFILTIADSGLRLSEICGLRRNQFVAETSSIEIDPQTALPLPPATCAAISAYLQARHNLDQQQHTSGLPLFARHDKRAGIHVYAISRWTGANIVDAWAKQALDPAVRTALIAANQHITPHTFRHYFVMNALRNTENDVATTQAMARHADRSTTRRYLQKLASDQSIATKIAD